MMVIQYSVYTLGIQKSRISEINLVLFCLLKKRLKLNQKINQIYLTYPLHNVNVGG